MGFYGKKFSNIILNLREILGSLFKIEKNINENNRGEKLIFTTTEITTDDNSTITGYKLYEKNV